MRDSLDKELLAHGTKIIRGESLSALAQGHALIKKARKDAAVILKDARNRRHQEQAKGYEEGKQQAQEDMAQQLIETSMAAVNYIEHLEESVTNLVMDALLKILDDMSEREKLRKIVAKALKNLRDQERIRLRIAKEDMELIKKDVAEGYFGSLSQIMEITSDSSLPRGSAILESDLGVIDASLPSQLRAIKKALGQAFKKEATDE